MSDLIDEELRARMTEEEIAAIPHHRDVPWRKPSASLFSCWWGMQKAQREVCDEPFHPDDWILVFSGSGASCMVAAKDLDLVCEILAKYSP